MKKNALEWTVFFVGLVAVLTLFGYLIREEVFQGNRPPDLKVSLEEPVRTEGGYRTRVTVENKGDEAAIGVQIKVDDADLNLDYVPRRSKRQGYVFTKKPPKSGEAVSSQTP